MRGRLRRAIRALSDRAEFWIVIVVAFGWFILTSTVAFFDDRARVMTNGRIIGLVGTEVVLSLVVAWFLGERGATLVQVGVRPTVRNTVAGLALYFAATFSMNICYAVFATILGTDVPRAAVTGRGLSVAAVVLVSIVNPFFEETLVAGYIIRATGEHGAAFAITASALVRFLYHTYQGPVAAVCILPMGFIFGAVYYRYRELWPLIVAHGIMDLLALGRLALSAG